MESNLDATETALESAIYKLHYGCDRGSWHTDLTSEECLALCELLVRYAAIDSQKSIESPYPPQDAGGLL